MVNWKWNESIKLRSIFDKSIISGKKKNSEESQVQRKLCEIYAVEQVAFRDEMYKQVQLFYQQKINNSFHGSSQANGIFP